MFPDAVPPWLFSAFSGAFTATACFWVFHRLRVGSYRKLAKKILRISEKEAKSKALQSQLEQEQARLNQQKELEQTWIKEREKMAHARAQVNSLEQTLSSRLESVEKKLSKIEQKELQLNERLQRQNAKEAHIQKLENLLQQQLSKSASLSSEEAKALLMSTIQDQAEEEGRHLSRRIIDEAKQSADQQAQTILCTAINRLAIPCSSKATTTTVSLPSEDLKGRIIGREGRNIRTLERETGVNFLIDDTPGAVVISGFDPIRRQIAKVALSELVLDGRIHPSRIEEAVKKARQGTQRLISQSGEDAAVRVGCLSLHPKLKEALGELKFQCDQGKNLLEQSLEVSHLLGLMASELQLNTALAKRIGLLHAIGKTCSHELSQNSASAGHDLALKYGESQEVANGIGCYLGQLSPVTPEGSLCSAAYKIVTSRPGAQIAAVGEYIKRLKHLEEVIYEFPGIEKAYALQSGKEVRLVVLPEMVDDQGLVNLVRDVSNRIQQRFRCSGKIRVTAIREQQAVEYVS